MTRRLINLLTVLSVLACLVVCAWYVAGSIGHHFKWRGTRWEAGANRKEVWLSNYPQRTWELKREDEEIRQLTADSNTRRIRLYTALLKQNHEVPEPEARVREELAVARFDAESEVAESRLRQSLLSRRSPRRYHAIPIALALGAASALPAARIIAFALQENGRRARRRLAAGLCPSCGYDLTGNVSGACPECGSERIGPSR